MAERRPYGSGSISRRADGRWLAQLRLPPTPTNPRPRVTAYAHSREEAERKIAALYAKAAGGQLAQAGRLTVAAFLEQWLEEVVRPRREPTTYLTYRPVVRHRLVPLLGHLRLAALTPRHVEQAYTALGRRYAPTSVRETHNILKNALETAVRWELLPTNPARRVEAPKRDSAPPLTFSRVEVQRLLRAIASDPWEALWLLKLTTGLRRGELLGLRWADVSRDYMRVTVRARLQYLGAEGFVLKAGAKTAAGVRQLRLGPRAAAALRRHRQRQREQRVAAPDWADLDLVFANPRGGYEYGPSVRRRWLNVLKVAGLPPRKLHALRHTHASVRLALGDPVTDVSADLGHSSPAVTLAVYSRALPDRQLNPGERLEVWLEEDD